MSEQGKIVLMPTWQLMHKGRSTDMNLYYLLRKADNGLGSDRLPRHPRELTPVEINARSLKQEVAMIGDSHPLAP